MAPPLRRWKCCRCSPSQSTLSFRCAFSMTPAATPPPPRPSTARPHCRRATASWRQLLRRIMAKTPPRTSRRRGATKRPAAASRPPRSRRCSLPTRRSRRLRQCRQRPRGTSSQTLGRIMCARHGSAPFGRWSSSLSSRTQMLRATATSCGRRPLSVRTPSPAAACSPPPPPSTRAPSCPRRSSWAKWPTILRTIDL